MTEQNVEANQEQVSQATEPVSAEISQEASTTETALRTELDALKSDLRGLQGKMDKDAQAVEKRLMGRFEQVAGQLGVNLSPEQKMNLRVMDLEEQLASVGQAAAKPQPQTVKEPQQQVNIAAIKQAYNDIDFNDPKVLEAVSKNLNNEDGLLAALGKIKVGNVGKPQPTSASVASKSGGMTTSNASMEALQQEYNQLSSAQNWKSGKERRAEIMAQMNQLDNA